MRFVLARMVALTAILALGSGLAAAPALADGDPASDVLAEQPLFLPQDANASGTQQAELGTLLQLAGRSGYPIRVALISSPADLGSVTELWRQPQTYARFLGQELSLAYHGPLLVVMPNGFGLSGFPGSGSTNGSVLTPLGGEIGRLGIAAAAVSAIERLAAASGHPLAVAAPDAPVGSSSTDPSEWIALALGSVLILAAWGASLRARPLQLRGRGVRSE